MMTNTVYAIVIAAVAFHAGWFLRQVKAPATVSVSYPAQDVAEVVINGCRINLNARKKTSYTWCGV